MNTVLITNGNLLSMLSLGQWLAEHGHHLKAVFVTTKLPSTKSNVGGLFDLFFRSGLAYTYFKLRTNRILPIRFALHGLPTTIPELVDCYGHPTDVTFVENINAPEVIEQIRSYAPKILLSFSATSRFCDELIAVPTRVAINIHYALLPAYAGLSPYYWYVAHQESVCGITMHVIHSKLDAGPIICQERFEATGNRSVMGLLIKQMALVSPALCRYYRGDLHEDNAVAQDLSRRSYFRHPTRAQIREFRRKHLVFATRQDVQQLATVAKELRDRGSEVRSKVEQRFTTSDRRDESPDREAEAIGETWYAPAARESKSGWLVYTLDFVLATLQSRVAEPHRIRRTMPWLFAGIVVRSGMAIAQALIMILAWVPVVSWCLETLARTISRNAPGFFLRSCFWKAKLKHLGCDTIIDQGVEIWGPANISIGAHCHIDTSVRLAAGERRHRQHGFIQIGNHVHLGPGVHVAGRGGVIIEDFVGISANAHLYSATNTIEYPPDPGRLISMSHMAPQGLQHVVEKRIILEKFSFIGMMVRIMPGVRVGRGAVVHANTELTRDVPPFSNFGGIPRGRHVGWRRPRRRSPYLKSDAQTNSSGNSVGQGESSHG